MANYEAESQLKSACIQQKAEEYGADPLLNVVRSLRKFWKFQVPQRKLPIKFPLVLERQIGVYMSTLLRKLENDENFPLFCAHVNGVKFDVEVRQIRRCQVFNISNVSRDSRFPTSIVIKNVHAIYSETA